MHGILELARRPMYSRPLITLYGESGIGKTEVASCFPNPIFVPTEDGLKSVAHKDIMAMPLAKSVDEVFAYLNALLTEEHSYETVVLDSISGFDLLAINSVLESDPSKPRSLNQALRGYGAGYEAVGKIHGELRALCDRLNKERGMTVLFIGHSQQKVMESPDCEPYSYYELKITRTAKYHFVDNVDLVGYMKLQSRLTKVDDKDKISRIISTDERAIVCKSNLAFVTKNRYGVNEDIPVQFGQNPFGFLLK